MPNLVLTTEAIIVPELLTIAQSVQRQREYCIVRNYVAATLYGDGLNESEIARALEKHPATIYHTLKVHQQDCLMNEAYNAIIRGLSAL